MYLVGNWKMSGSRAFTASYLSGVINTIEQYDVSSRHTVILCPPVIWLCDAVTLCADNCPLQIGAQDCHYQSKGAYTGDISPAMLKEAGCSYVILGHSERRREHHETDMIVAEKVRAALDYALEPIICIGETEQQRSNGDYLAILCTQLTSILAQVGKRASLIVAYEPVWAIGTGRTPTIDEIEEVCKAIFLQMKKYGIQKPSVLYGGSVKASNVADILSITMIDGVLVGSASTKAEEWTGIMKAATSIRN